MSTRFWLLAKYTLFCAIAMFLNLGTQYIADVSFSPSLWFSMGIGTVVGLFSKYLLDRNYIFRGRGATIAKDARRFLTYTVMGAGTTGVFWLTEWVFAATFSFVYAKYVGGAIGQVIGYLIKYQLDKRWVFVEAGRSA